MIRACLQPLIRTLLAARHALSAYAISVAAHTALVVGLSWIVFDIEHSASPSGLLAAFDGQQETVQPAALIVASAETASTSEGNDAPAAGAGPLVGMFDELPGLEGFQCEVTRRGTRGGQLGVGLGAALDQELPTPDESSAPSDASFFGVAAKGKSFVFIVDMSLSMAADRRFHRAKAELKRSIEALSQDKKFYVIFYNDETWPMPAEWLVPATTRNVQDTMKWFKRVNPNGGTDPMAAVKMAVEMRSDAIFLLTDGEFSHDVEHYLDWGRTSDRTPIHTISFVSRLGEPLLKAISRMTGGTYRHVK